MASNIAVITIRPRVHTGFAKAQEFILKHPNNQVVIGRDCPAANNVDTMKLYDQHGPGNTLVATPYKTRGPNATLQIMSISELDYLFTPSPYISWFHSFIKWNGEMLALTLMEPCEPAQVAPRTFVNHEAFSVGQLKFLRTGDVITFCEHTTTEPFCQLVITRVGYGRMVRAPDYQHLY